jgi:hypothetical protein
MPSRFVGYARGAKGYVVWVKGRFIESAGCMFDERPIPDATHEPQLSPYTGTELVDETPQPDADMVDQQTEPSTSQYCLLFLMHLHLMHPHTVVLTLRILRTQNDNHCLIT